jgi:hypothetical protein
MPHIPKVPLHTISDLLDEHSPEIREVEEMNKSSTSTASIVIASNGNLGIRSSFLKARMR